MLIMPLRAVIEPAVLKINGGARLTPPSEQIVVSARRILAELSLMYARAAAGRIGEASRLEIGLYTSLSTGAVRDSIFSFARSHPHVEVNTRF